MIFLLYLAFPIVEIYLLIKAGEALGFWPIFGIVVLTAWIGSRLVKYEGFQVLNQLRQKTVQGRSPHQELIEGAVLLVGGVLLITPGFITDGIGFLCLIPLSRKWIALSVKGALLKKVQQGSVRVYTNFTHQRPTQRQERDVSPEVIDVKSEALTD